MIANKDYNNNSNNHANPKSESNRPSTISFEMTPEELKSRLEGDQHLMVFDIGERGRFERRRIPGSAYAFCDESAKKNIMPKLSKNVEIVLVSDDDEYTRQMPLKLA